MDQELNGKLLCVSSVFHHCQCVSLPYDIPVSVLLPCFIPVSVCHFRILSLSVCYYLVSSLSVCHYLVSSLSVCHFRISSLSQYPPKWFQRCLVVTWLVPRETAAVSAHVPCTPYNHAPMYSATIRSHIHPDEDIILYSWRITFTATKSKS